MLSIHAVAIFWKNTFNNKEYFASDANYENLDDSREIMNVGMLNLSMKLWGQKYPRRF